MFRLFANGCIPHCIVDLKQFDGVGVPDADGAVVGAGGKEVLVHRAEL